MLDRAAGLPPLQTIPIDVIRAGDIARYNTGVTPDLVASTEDRFIDGPRGDIRIRIYRPALRSGLPVLVFFHGSGFVICSIETHDAMCRQLCRRANVIVVSVDYALAPEQKFPAAPDDCLAATRWVALHAHEFGGDAWRLAVGGDSAGGNLAAVTAIRARDEGGPNISAQLLLYPVTDHYTGEWPSYVERGTGCGLTAAAMSWFWDLYLDDPSEAADPHASPMRANNLAGLPKSYIVVGGYDLLRDEGEEYARLLAKAGGIVELVRYDDMNHGFLAWVGVMDRASEAMDAVCAWLRDSL